MYAIRALAAMRWRDWPAIPGVAFVLPRRYRLFRHRHVLDWLSILRLRTRSLLVEVDRLLVLRGLGGLPMSFSRSVGGGDVESRETLLNSSIGRSS